MGLQVGDKVYIVPLDRFGEITRVENLEELEFADGDWFPAHACYWVRVRGYSDDDRVFGEEELESLSSP